MRVKKRDEELNIKEYIPLDKSWMMRVGVLDMLGGHKDIQIFLESQKDLSADLAALLRSARAWSANEPIDVGESGTLYRFLQFASWKLHLNKTFIKHGTLRERAITEDAGIIEYPLSRLLELDHSTSQWASAAVLCGSNEMVENPPYKLMLTYEAVEHWRACCTRGKRWEPRYDETIHAQADAFLGLLRGERPRFESQQAEDYCFARTFEYMTKEEGLRRWPNLQGHESNRIEAMELELEHLKEGDVVTSKDHRVVQALAMKAMVDAKDIQCKYPNVVAKSWPQFWDFLKKSRSRY